MATLRDHEGPIHAVAFSPDGTTLASGGGDGVIRLWQGATRKEADTKVEAVVTTRAQAITQPDAEFLLLRQLALVEPATTTDQVYRRNRVLTDLGPLYLPGATDQPIKLAVLDELLARPALSGAPALAGTSPILFPLEKLAGRQAVFHILGPPGSFRVIKVTGGVDCSPMAGDVPGEITVSTSTPGLHPFSFDVETRGQRLVGTGALLLADWDLRFFSWNDTQDPQTHTDQWHTVLSGKPLTQDKVHSIDFCWGSNPPASQVPKDRFCVVATTSIDLPAGQYEVWTASDDGVRVWIDDQLVIDGWAGAGTREHSTALPLGQGAHTIRIEHFDRSYHAQLLFGMVPTATTTRGSIPPPGASPPGDRPSNGS